MNCREARRWLSPYLDSELDQTKTFEISEHLRACSTCERRYDQERRVDAALADRLSDVPAMDWDRIERKALGADRHRLWWRVASVGMAACLAIALWTQFGRRDTAVPVESDWLASAYVAATPDRSPFVLAADHSFDLARESRAALGFDLSAILTSDLETMHDFKWIDAAHKVLPDGTPYVEIRLNCCGKPVLLAVARRDAAAAFGALAEAVAGSDGTTLASHGGIYMASAADDRIVILAASHHPVEDVIRAIKPKAA